MFSPDGRFVLSTGGDRTVRLWDLATASPDRLWLPHAAPHTEGSFSPDGRVLATAENDGVRFWDAATGALLGPPLSHARGRSWILSFQPGRALAS